MMDVNKRTKVLIVLGLIGAVISSYLIFKTADPSSVVCSIGGGCETVLSSKYAKLGGFPVAALGLIWYVIYLGLVWFVVHRQLRPQSWIHTWLVAGIAFSLYLLVIETFIIHAYCTWCLGSLATIVAISAVFDSKET